MHIVVLLKQVHEPNTPLSFMSIDKEGKALVLEGSVSLVLNAYDANAIEEAVKWKEKQGATITALSVGDKSTVAHLRRAIGMGADRGIHIEGPSGIDGDPAVVGGLISAALAKLDRVDLVLCGRQASDTDAGQVPFIVAQKSRMTPILPVIGLLKLDADAVELQRLCEGGSQRLRVKLPALLGVSNEINKPRAASLRGVMAGKKAVIPTWTATELGIQTPRPGLTLEKLSWAPRTTLNAELIAAGTDEAAGRALADRLKAEGLL
jgi:electron transfer flavoprotein beta subunit